MNTNTPFTTYYTSSSQIDADIDRELLCNLKYHCSRGELDELKKLVSFHNLGNNPSLLHSSLLVDAAENGHFNIVKYLTTSPELEYKPDIYLDNNKVLGVACSNGYLDIVKFLIESPDVNYSFDINENKSPFFFALLGQRINIVEYFIFDQHLMRDQDVEKILAHYKHLYEASVNQFNSSPTNSLLDVVYKLFALSETHDRLEKELPINNTVSSIHCKI